MIRRFVTAFVAVAALLGTGTLTGCSDVGTSDAAVVNGVSLSNDTLHQWLGSALSGQVQQRDDTSLATGQFARDMVTWWIQDQLFKAAGVSADAAAFDTAAGQQYTAWADAPADMKASVSRALSTMRALEQGTLEPGNLTDLLKQATIHVDPRIGVWDPGKFSVVAHS